MKTSTLPSLRVDPELRKAAEDILKEGESLSSFIENAVKRAVDLRKLRQEFHARGLAALREVEEGAPTFSADEVHAELERIVSRAERGE
jgi:predicted transcriptional regulator